MNQSELVALVAKKHKLTAKDAKQSVQAVLGAISDSLAKGNPVRTNLGTFSIAKRKARKGRNPQTGEAIKVKASKSVKFKASKPIRDKLNRR